MIVFTYSNIDIIQGVIGYGNATEGITDWRITNTNSGIFNISNSSSIIRPSGGTSEIGEITGSTDRYMIFTAGPSTFTVPSGGIKCDILIVGGGGGGGFDGSGGGGGGEVKYYTNNITTFKTGTSYTLSEGTYTVNVGTGGAAGVSVSSAGTNGTISEIKNNLGTTLLSAGGGGGGGSRNTNGVSGVGGGGGAGHGASYTGGSSTGSGGIGGNSSSTYTGGGGAGGANVANKNGGNGSSTIAGIGGVGANIDITGILAGYGGGGGGGTHLTATRIIGTQGGGNGGTYNDMPTSGTSNTGGGGGGGGNSGALNSSGTGGAGGSGIVIIRYSTANISIIDNGNVGFGITPTTNSSLVEIAGDVNITGNYKINNIDIINSTSNYVLSTSNLLVSRISTGIKDTSNYVSTINTALNTRINDTSNYMRTTSNILANSISGQWTSTSSGIYYNTPISTPITLPNEIGVEKYMVFTYTGDTIAGSGQTRYTINIPTGGILCDILVVGGGGSGGNDRGGGGGGGGVIYTQNITLNGTFTILVGNGGIGNTSSLPSGSGTRGTNGNSTSISGSGLTTITAIGGGAGGSCHPSVKNGLDGGSGGGGSQYGGAGSGGIGTTGQGNNGGVGYEGGAAGGGGGAVAIGTNATSTNAGNGGIGILIPITGTSVIYGSGGGGGGSFGSGIGGYNQVFGTGGSNGAGNGANVNANGENATIYGCGGGGGGLATTIVTKGGNGASGVVIIKYYSIQQTIQKSISSSLVTSATVTTGITTGTIGATDGYMMFTYTTDNTGLGQTRYALNITQNIICDLLIVGGGGGGARRFGGGGGAGALIYESNFTFPTGTYYINVGNGGAGNSRAGNLTDAGNTVDNKRAQNGFDSEIMYVQNTSMTPITIYRAKGGGGGLGGNSATSTTIFPNEFSPLPGGSGGGNGGKDGAAGGLLSALNIVAGSSTIVVNNIASDSMNPSYVGGKCFGNEGGRGGGDSPWLGSGGGGAGARGTDVNTLGNATANNFAGVGGIGLQYSITGSSVYYAGGGGGGNWDTSGSAFYNDGGLGGGGRSSTKTVAPIAGSPNTGGGGGGDGADVFSGANGGSGVVIIKYYSIQQTVQQYITSIPVIAPNVVAGITTETTNSLITTFRTTDSYMMFTYTSDSPGLTGQTEYIINITENINCDILIVGGGGGGGNSGIYENGGGGGGGIVYMVKKTFVPGTYYIHVGKGGIRGAVGADSSIRQNNAPISFDGISIVGKGGGNAGDPGGNGGSGGGGNYQPGYINNYGTATQGNTFWDGTTYVPGGFNGKLGSRYTGGSGGGAAEAGGIALKGGDGRAVSITGTSVFYGGGGGGAELASGGQGGNGGGGSGGAYGNGTPGTPNTGGGGGGSDRYYYGANGGSGVIIIKYSGINQTIQQYITSTPAIAPNIVAGITSGTTNSLITTLGTTDSYMIFAYTIDNTGSGQTQYIINIKENINCDILIVGGGGGGGKFGGGGGGGGILFADNIPLNSGSYTIRVGDGGGGDATPDDATDGINGNDSSITINSVQYIAKGGGGGGSRGVSSRGRNGVAGGSGGGGSGTNDTAYVGFGGISNKNTYDIFQSFGNNGGQGKPDLTGPDPSFSSGGGGGAGSTGSDFSRTTGGGNGGTGKDFISYFGTTIGDNGWFGGGGGGNTYINAGTRSFGNGGSGLFGGGGRGGYESTTAELSAENGLSNTGGGGGGSIWDGVSGGGGIFGGKGGSGVVIIRYRKNTITAFVGIGTTNPISELHVYDDINNNTKLTIQNNYTDPIVITPNIIESLVLPDTLFATNPTGVTSGIINDTDRFYIFTHTGGYNTNTAYNNISIPNGITFDILMIGGGGAGGGIGGAGGGSGACLVAVNQTLPAGTYTFVVGGAGSGGITGSGNIGYDTYIHFSGTEIYKARGGGGGSADAKNGVIGGCSGGAAGGINNIAYTSPSPATNNLYQTLTSGPIVNTTLLYSIYANKGGDVTATTTYETINYGGGGGIGAAAANANTTSRSTPGGDGLYQVTLNGTLYNLRTHFTNNGTFGVQDGTTGNFFIGGGGGGGGYNPAITPTNISGGKGGGGIGKNGNSPANGTDGMPNTGSGGGAGSTGLGGNSLGGNGGSGLLIFRYRNRAKYKVTETLESNIYYRTLTFTYSPNYPPDPPNTTLLAWYRFDGDGLDYSPWTTKYNLIANVGTPTYSSGTATDSFLQGRRYINTSTGSLRNTSLSLSSRAFSVAVWQRRKNSNRAFFVAQGTAGANTTVIIGPEDNNTYFLGFHNNDLVTSAYPSDLNTWIHMVYVVLPNYNRRIYRNGVLIAIDDNGSAVNCVGDLRIGGNYYDNTNVNIELSDLRIYTNGLSSTEVEQLYNSYTNSLITDNYGINFPNTLGLTVNGTSKTVKGQYNISTGHINSSVLPLEGQSDIPLASTATTTVTIKYPYNTFLPILPNEIQVDEDKYMIFTYTGDTLPSSGQTQYTINIPTGGISCDILIIGGGGGGGNWTGGNYECGGGGAGAYLYVQSITLNGTYTFSVGKGGELSTKGSNSEIKSGSTTLYSCEGGGNGGFNGGNAGSGGSGGGGQFGFTFAVANDATRGFNGAAGATNSGVNEGGGGGGAGSAGLLRDGGIGKINNITGVNVYYAGGGGGCSYRALGGGVGGLGGGGTGSSGSINATNGEDNTGSGGGGGYHVNSRQAGKGGSGIIIIKNNTIGKSISSSPITTDITKGTIGTSDRTISFRYTYNSPGLTGQTLYTFTPVQNIICDILVVGGGGGGGKGGGGGGGGGGVLFGVNLKLNASSSISVKVGKGGTGATTNDNGVRGTNGNDSSITINGIEYIAKGGGGGGSRNSSSAGTNGIDGGSGGGGSHANIAPQGQGGASNKNNYANFQSFGNSGGLGKLGTSAPEPSHAGGGGGGAGSIGSNATGSGTGPGGGNGGFGKEFIAYFGRSIGHNGYFAGGGGGATYNNAGNRGYGNGGLELYGGGGNAGFDGTMAYFADNGMPNTGGGGGGAFFSTYSYNSNFGGNGGSGFVIIRYRINTTQTSSIELMRNTAPPNEILVAGTTSTTIGQFDRLISFPYTSDSTGLVGQTQYTFTTTENLICDILIVAGGGGGGMNSGGGGGAGGLILLQNINLFGTYTIKIGRGGAGGTQIATNTVAENGINTSFETYIAIGGGAGVNSGGANGNPGGSGGGAANDMSGNRVGGAGTAGQGNKGGDGTIPGGSDRTGGGGGGAGEAGQTSVSTSQGGKGGIGRDMSLYFGTIFGVNGWFAGGGGGGGGQGTGGIGGTGGGGNGGINNQEGINGTGGGGGGAHGNQSTLGKKGGSGIVIIRYRRNTGYKIGNYNGDFKIISSSTAGDTDYMRITADGASIYNPTGTPLWSTVSDRRIKENIEKASYDKCYDNINKLELYRFNYIKELHNINKDNKQLGYIAQEVIDIFPKAVSTQTFYNNSLSISDLLSIDISQINYSLYGAIKKLIELYNDVEKRVDALEKVLNIENDLHIVLPDISTTTSNLNIDISTTNNISFYTPPETNIIVDTLTTSNIIDILSASTMSIYTSNNIIYDILTSNNISFYTPPETNIIIDIRDSNSSNIAIE